MVIPNYIIPINKGERKIRGKIGKKNLFLYDSAITYYIIPINKKRKEREGEGKEREESFLCVYDSAINIHVFMLDN